jgi:hypothetical protein
MSRASRSIPSIQPDLLFSCLLYWICVLPSVFHLTTLTKYTKSMCVVVAQSVSCLLIGLLFVCQCLMFGSCSKCKVLGFRITVCLSVSDVSLDLCCSLVESSKARRARLEDSRNIFQFLQDHEEEEAWLVEKQRICKAGISAKDLRAVLSLQQKHKVSLFAVCCRETHPLCWPRCWSQWDCNGWSWKVKIVNITVHEHEDCTVQD